MSGSAGKAACCLDLIKVSRLASTRRPSCPVKVQEGLVEKQVKQRRDGEGRRAKQRRQKTKSGRRRDAPRGNLFRKSPEEKSIFVVRTRREKKPQPALGQEKCACGKKIGGGTRKNVDYVASRAPLTRLKI